MADEAVEAQGGEDLDLSGMEFGEEMEGLVDEVVTNNDDGENKDDKSGSEGDDKDNVEDKSNNKDGDDEVPDDLLEEGNEEEDEEEEEIDPPEGLDEKQAEAFKTMRTKLAEARKQIKEGAGIDKDSQSRLQELEAKEAALNYSESEEFKAAHVQPMTDLSKSILDTAKSHEIDEAVINQAARLGKTERTAFLKSNIDDADAILEIVPMLSQLDSMRATAQQAITEKRESYSKSVQQRREQEATQRTELLANTIKELGEVHPLLRASVKKPEWLQGIQEGAMKIIDGSAPPEDVVKAALKAQVTDRYLSLYAGQVKAVKALKAEVAKLKGLRPDSGASGGDDTDKGGGGGGDQKAKSIDDLLP